MWGMRVRRTRLHQRTNYLGYMYNIRWILHERVKVMTGGSGLIMIVRNMRFYYTRGSGCFDTVGGERQSDELPPPRSHDGAPHIVPNITNYGMWKLILTRRANFTEGIESEIFFFPRIVVKLNKKTLRAFLTSTVTFSITRIYIMTIGLQYWTNYWGLWRSYR